MWPTFQSYIAMVLGRAQLFLWLEFIDDVYIMCAYGSATGLELLVIFCFIITVLYYCCPYKPSMNVSGTVLIKFSYLCLAAGY